MWWANPVPDGFLHHGTKGFSEAPVFGANLITLLHHLYRLAFGDRVQPTQAADAGRNHRVGCQLQTVFGRDSVRSLGNRLEVERATLGVEQINDPPELLHRQSHLARFAGLPVAAREEQLLSGRL